MVVPCITVTHYGPAPAAAPASGAAPIIKAGTPHLHHHVVHAAHRVVHAVTAHRHVWTEIVCRAAPLAIASGIVATPLPAGPPATKQPAMVAPQPSTVADNRVPVASAGTPATSPQSLPVLQGFPSVVLAPPAATPSQKSSLITLTRTIPTPATPNAVTLAPYIAPAASPGKNTSTSPPGGSTPTGVTTPGGIPRPVGSGTPVPEPSSLGLLISALGGLLLFRRRIRQIQVPQKVCKTR